MSSESDYYNASVIANLQEHNKITSLEWIWISFQVATAVKYMHLKNFLDDDIKPNNVLLKLKEGNWLPILMDMDKELEVYRLSALQTEKSYKKISPFSV